VEDITFVTISANSRTLSRSLKSGTMTEICLGDGAKRIFSDIGGVDGLS
jgi:hypothetical protein